MKLTGSDRLRESRAYKAGIAGFAIGLLFIMVAAVVATVSLYSHYRAESWMDRTHQVTQLVQSMLLQLQEADLWQRRYIIGADERDLASFGEASRKAILELERLGGLTAVERDQQERLGAIRPLVLAHLAALQEGIDQRRRGGFAAAAGEVWRDGAPAALDRIRGLLVDMEREEWRLLAERTEAAAAARHRLGAFTAAGSAVGVLVAAVGAVNAWRSRRAVLATYAQLQESEERLRLLGDNLPDSMVYQYTYDLDGSRRFLYISSGVERINGVTVADVLRDPGCLHRQVDPEQLPALLEAERVSGRDLTDFAMDVRMRRSDGQWRWMQLRSRPRRQSDGSVIWNGVQTDITERKHMEAALRESEEKFRTMAENARAVVGIVQGKRFVYANPYLAEISGYTVEEILAMDFVEMVHPDFRQMVVDYARRRQLGEAVPSHYQFAMVTKSGQTRWMDFSPGRSEYHGQPAIVGIAYDITARKQAEESLRENEARLRLAQEAGRVGTFEWDLHTNEVRWTPELESLYGLPSGGFSGRYEDWLKMLHPEDLAESERILREGIERGAMESEFRVVWPDGTVRWLSGRGQVIRDEAGRAERLIGVNIDVTERKQAEQLLAAAKHSAERAKQVAEEASAAKDHFLAVLSHELRNPLTPVLPALAALERLVAEEGAEYLEVARRNVELEARLIDDLLDVTRIARGKVELHKQDIGLCAVIRSAVEVCKSDLEARGLHFAMELDAGASCHVHGDAARLQQVFWNLLKNAIKFTPPGGCVGIRCWQEDRRAMTQIVDSGVGIAPEAMGRIFNAFEQETRSITRQFGGLGLGLAISRALVEMHGGSIGASSAGRDKGATFTVELPIVDSQLLEKPSTPAVNTQSCGGDRKLRILLVEDHGDTARILSRLLASEGHAVRHAGDVATAMKLAREEEFDVLLSDLGLPDGSGHDLMRQLIASGKHLPGIALSGFGMASDVKQSREAGFLEHVTKPVNFETLSAALNRAACAQRSLEGGVSVGLVQERGRSAG